MADVALSLQSADTLSCVLAGASSRPGHFWVTLFYVLWILPKDALHRSFLSCFLNPAEFQLDPGLRRPLLVVLPVITD